MGESPLDVARRDHEEWVVADILGHQGSTQRRSTLRFLVRWSGATDGFEETWEPYSSLRHLDKLHAYLRDHNMSSLIPPSDRP